MTINRFTTKASRILLGSIFVALAVPAYSQTTISWTTTSPTGDSGNWSDTTKWQGGDIPDNLTGGTTPARSENANFGAYANNRVITLDNDYSINALTIIPRDGSFVAKSFSLTTSTGKTLTIGAGGVTIGTGGTPSVSINIELGADQTWTTSTDNVSNAASFSGTISGTGKLTRTDQLTSNSNSVYTFSGANTFNGGYVSSATSGTGLVVTQLGSSSVVTSGSIASGPLGTGTVTLNGGRLASNGGTARTLSNNIVIGGNITLGNSSQAGDLTFSDTGLTTASTFTLGSATNGNVSVLRTGATNLIFDQVIAESGGTGQSVLFATTSGTPTVTLDRTKTATGNILAGGVALVLNNGSANSGSLIGVNGSITATGTNKFSSGALISDNTAIIATDASNYTAVSGGKATVYNNARVSFATDQTQAVVAGLFTSDSQVRLGLGSGSASTATTENYNQSAIGNGTAGLVSASTGTVTYTGTLTSGSDNTFRVGGGLGTLSLTGSTLTGSGKNASIEGGGTVNATADQNYTGTTTVNSALTLSGAAGALSATSGITVNNTSLTLDNTTANANRLANSAGITLNRGTLAMNNSSTAIAESIGTLTIGSGYNIISMGTAAGASNTKSINTGTLARTAGTVALFRGDSFGLASAGGSALTRNLVIVTTAPSGVNFVGGGGAGGTPTTSIIPWARTGTGTSATGGNFLTFDSSNNSLRALVAAEFNTGADTTWGTTENVKQTNAATGTTTLLTAGRTVNSFILSNAGASAATIGSLGGFTLNVTSGAVDLSHTVNQNFTLNNGTLAFGSAEGIITNSGASGAATTLSAVLTGSGGVSVFANNGGTLTISGTNLFTGGITVGSNGSSIVGVSNDNNFGDSANAITHAGGELRFFAAFSSARAITLLASVGNNTLGNNTTSSTVILTGNITGGGLLRLVNNASTVGTGGFSLGGASSNYSGGTQIEGINVSTTTNNALGTGTVALIGANNNAAALTLGGAGTAPTLGGLRGTDGTVTVTTTDTGNAATLSIGSNNENTVFNGVIAQGAGKTASLTKTGTGSLVLGGNNTYTGPTNVSGGTLLISGSISGSTTVAVNAGGTLLLGGVSTDHINDTAAVTLGAGATPGTGGIFKTGGLSEGPAGGASGSAAAMGALTLSLNSTIDFATGALGSTLLFSSLNYTPGDAVRILNWSGGLGIDDGSVGNDRLLFTGDPGFSTAQLSGFQFYNDSGVTIGTGATQISFNGYTELVPVPEPNALWIGAAGFVLIAWRERRRLRRA